MSSTLVAKTTPLMTSRTSIISKISKSNWIKACIAFGFYFCDHDFMTRLMFKEQTIKMTF